MSRLLDILRDAAAERGLDALDVAPVQVESFPRFVEWLEEGHHGEMGYMARDPERRRDAGRLLEGARSVVTVAANYRTGEPAELEPLHGRVARYAWGSDYHDVLKEDLDALASLVERETGERTRTYVDTGAILERDFGARAGLGFVAKNTMLIRPNLGSHFFLGEILTTADIETDAERVKPGCGSCTICIDDCPTAAITEPYVVDSRRCISYLTIELRGPIPRDLRPLMGRWVFGCDVCQDCCPWNAHAHETAQERYAGRRERQAPHLPALLALSAQEFNARYRGTPLSRPKRPGLLRNACVALGNEANPEALPALLGALSDAEPLVRGHAAWALGALAPSGGSRLLSSVRNALESARGDVDEFVRAEVTAALDTL